MLDVKYKELGGSGLVTTPLNMAPNLSECNVSHAGIALLIANPTPLYCLTARATFYMGPIQNTKLYYCYDHKP